MSFLEHFKSQPATGNSSVFVNLGLYFFLIFFILFYVLNFIFMDPLRILRHASPSHSFLSPFVSIIHPCSGPITRKILKEIIKI